MTPYMAFTSCLTYSGVHGWLPDGRGITTRTIRSGCGPTWSANNEWNAPWTTTNGRCLTWAFWSGCGITWILGNGCGFAWTVSNFKPSSSTALIRYHVSSSVPSTFDVSTATSPTPWAYLLTFPWSSAHQSYLYPSGANPPS